jgi:hypothetical protein
VTHIDKVEEILNEISWEDLVAKDWVLSFTLGFKGLLHSIVNDKTDSIDIWRKYFSIACLYLAFREL